MHNPEVIENVLWIIAFIVFVAIFVAVIISPLRR